MVSIKLRIFRDEIFRRCNTTSTLTNDAFYGSIVTKHMGIPDHAHWDIFIIQTICSPIQGTVSNKCQFLRICKKILHMKTQQSTYKASKHIGHKIFFHVSTGSVNLLSFVYALFTLLFHNFPTSPFDPATTGVCFPPSSGVHEKNYGRISPTADEPLRRPPRFQILVGCCTFRRL